MTTTTPDADRTARTPAISPWCPRPLGYVLALVAVVAALILNLAVPALSGSGTMAPLFLTAILLSAYLGGLGAGLTATALAALLSDYFILPPRHSFEIARIDDGARWGLMIVLGLAVTLIVEKLRRSWQRAEAGRRRYANALGGIGDAVITTDRQGAVLMLNGEAERLTGWLSLEAAGRPFWEVFKTIAPATRAPEPDPVGRILRGEAGAGLAGQVVLVARDGREIPISSRGAPIRQAGGEITGVVLAFRDCTAEKAAESRLRENEERHRQVFENLPAAFASCRMIFEGDQPQDFVCLSANAAFEALTGLKNLAGRAAGEIVPGARATHPELFAACGRVASTGKPEKFRIRVAALAKWLSLDVYSPQKGLFAVLVEDVTDRKLNEEMLEFVAQSTTTRNGKFLTQLAGRIGRSLDAAVVVIGRIKDGQVVRIAGWYSREGDEPDTEYFLRGTPCREVMDHSVCFHGQKLQDLYPGDTRLARWGAQSYLGIPLAGSSGKPVGLIAVFDSKPMPGAQQATALLRIAAGRAAAEIEQFETGTTLRGGDSLFRSLVNTSPDAMTVADLEGRIEFTSPRALEIYGHEASENLVGRSLFEWVVPEEHEIVRTAVRNLIHARPMRGAEFTLLKKDGSRFNAEVDADLLREPDGRPTGLILITRDITERKRNEEMQKRLATAVEQAAEDIVITDAWGKIVYVNPAFETITGYSREQVIGCNPRILKSGRHDAAYYQDMWARLTRGEIWTGRIVNKRKDGTLVEQDMTISPIRDAGGKITHFVAVRRDVSREVDLETRLLQSQKLDAIGKLAGGVAHDFNNLLTAIRGNASLLLLGNHARDPDIADCAQQIVEAAERGANLTRQLLMFGRKQAIQPVMLDLNEVVAHMTKLLQRILGEDIALTSNYASNLPAIQADTGMIEQVLLNLAVNSRDAMPRGGQLTIATGTETLGPAASGERSDSPGGLFVRLTVSDTGTGITPENLPHIFEPFFTTKEVGKGSGLGLATVHGIVQQHSGRITVASETGRGTVFRIYFPVAASHSGGPAVGLENPAFPRGVETVLVVEDETIVRMAVGNMLQRFGYTVLSAASGIEALKVWRRHQDDIHLLLTDIVMPDGMTGFELARQLLDEKPGLKVIYTSGYSSEVADKRMTMVDGVNFLQKPYSPQKLALALRASLDPQ